MKYIWFLLCIIVVSLVLPGIPNMHRFVFGQTASDDIASTVKISVCGNSIKEGGEECDTSDLDSQTCSSLGFGSGNLSCDISCEFDTLACLPVPTNTPTPTLIPTSSTTSTSSPSNASIPQATIAPTSQLLPTQTSQIIHVTPQPQTASIPLSVQVFDQNGDGTINRTELTSVVKEWYDVWVEYIRDRVVINDRIPLTETSYERCDVNNDNICSLVDLSIIFYYVSL